MPLFKYVHPDRTDVLSGRAIRFSSALVLNDPFELKPHIRSLASQDYMDSALDRLMPQAIDEELAKLPPEVRALMPRVKIEERIRSAMPQMKKDVFQLTETLMPNLAEMMGRKFEELIGILCLSGSADNLPMWAHYADSHHGFVIEFNEHSGFFDQRVSSEDELRHLRKVIYRPDRPSLDLVEIEDFSPFMTKGTDWQYENEWRMLLQLQTASRILGEGSTAVHLFEFPGDAVNGIVFGCRMSEAKKIEIKSILEASPHYRHVRCHQSELDNEHYRLRIRAIDG